MAQKVLITTAIDYVNDVIHIGHSYQKIVADALARYHRQIGNDVFFLTGTDEHGSKTQETAEARGITPKEVADEISVLDQEQIDALNISYDRFIRTTDADHKKCATAFYTKAYENGDVYLDTYTGLYCIGCEEFLKEKDLVDGKCPNHPTKEPITVTEENYFFAWTKYADLLKQWISDNPETVQHDARRNEMLAFLDQGLEDIPISRTSVQFGIPVPNDPKHVLYVWFDALINYITGAPEYWEDEDARIIHLIGKDNVRWHALLWPAMLASAGYRLPSVVYGHDFFTINGQKISKSLGNVIRPTELVESFGVDAVRYYFLRYGPMRDDVDVTIEEIERIYTADLANGLGNLVARVAKMAEGQTYPQTTDMGTDADEYKMWQKHIEDFRPDLALALIWKKIQGADKYVDSHRIWELQGADRERHLAHLVTELQQISILLQPFLPETAARIQSQFDNAVNVADPLFPRRS